MAAEVNGVIDHAHGRQITRSDGGQDEGQVVGQRHKNGGEGGGDNGGGGSGDVGGGGGGGGGRGIVKRVVELGGRWCVRDDGVNRFSNRIGSGWLCGTVFGSWPKGCEFDPGSRYGSLLVRGAALSC